MARQTASWVHISPHRRPFKSASRHIYRRHPLYRRRNPETGKAVPRHRKPGLHGLLAQLVEQRTVNPQVTGSKPVQPSITAEKPKIANKGYAWRDLAPAAPIKNLLGVKRMEIWKDIQGYEGLYQISNYANVRRSGKCGEQKELRQHLNTYGYYMVNLSRNGEHRPALVHRLVATAFIDNPESLPCVNHKDEDKTNNQIENLEWCDKAYNNRYGTHPKQISEANSKPVLQIYNGKVVAIWKSCTEAAITGGFSISCIARCCSGERKTHKGYQWRWSTKISRRKAVNQKLGENRHNTNMVGDHLKAQKGRNDNGKNRCEID